MNFHPFGATAFASAASMPSIVPVISIESDDDDDYGVVMKPWNQPGWVPRQSSGKQKSPNMIRGELQRYIDECRANGTSTQTDIVEIMGVNANSFRKFMNPKTYKDQWSATQNGTYWAAAKLLEEVKYQKELAKKSGAKRKGDTKSEASSKKSKTSAAAAEPKKSRAEKQLEALELIRRINAVEGVSEVVYDSCPQIVAKIKAFLQRDGMTKANLLLALGNINSNSLGKFLAGKNQDQCGNVTYRTAYVFFEKLRILEGQPKSAARKKNEINQPHGFSLEKARTGRYFKFLPLAPHEYGYGL